MATWPQMSREVLPPPDDLQAMRNLLYGPETFSSRDLHYYRSPEYDARVDLEFDTVSPLDSFSQTMRLHWRSHWLMMEWALGMHLRDLVNIDQRAFLSDMRERVVRVYGRPLAALCRGGFPREEACAAMRAADRRLSAGIEQLRAELLAYYERRQHRPPAPDHYLYGRPDPGHSLHDRQPTNKAEVKAERLLLKHLTPGQRDQYNSSRSFVVEVTKGRNPKNLGQYRVSFARSYNVTRLRDNMVFCAWLTAEKNGVEGVAPICDQMLAQKLLLERDPDAFFRVANSARQDSTSLAARGREFHALYTNAYELDLARRRESR